MAIDFTSEHVTALIDHIHALNPTWCSKATAIALDMYSEGNATHEEIYRAVLGHLSDAIVYGTGFAL